MAAHPYSLRSRLNGQPPSIRTPPSTSPLLKSGSRSPKKTQASGISLQLRHVIGTTTTSPTGLTCCTETNSYAHCAGAVAALTTIHEDGTYAQRYFKAKPTASALNYTASHYDTKSQSSTPSGRRSSITPSRRFYDDKQTISFTKDWQDDNSGQTWTARERIKTATCVALSSDGRWLAVGESGYNPRVLLFSTATDSLLDVPVSIISDHTFGVRSVAFSPDSRYLATLGNLNDGFLFIWTFNSRSGLLRLHSVNKCTTNVCEMVWSDNSLITVGTRHVKVWQVGVTSKSTPMKRFKLRSGIEETSSPSSGPLTLQGRNCLLGSLVDCTFLCITPLAENLVVIGTDAGHLCLLDLSRSALELKVIKAYDSAITSITRHEASGALVIGGSRGLFREDAAFVETLMRAETTVNGVHGCASRKSSRPSAIRQSLGIKQSERPGVLAIGTLREHIVALDNTGNIFIELVSNEAVDLQTTFASHNDMIEGVQPTGVSSLGYFFTWSKNGEIKFWTEDGSLLSRKLVKLDAIDLEGDDMQNELRLVRLMSDSMKFITGDRFGILKIFNADESEESICVRAHSAEVTDIAVHERSSYIATCSRDRMVQLFSCQGSGLNLIQTMDEHIGAVNNLRFSDDAQKLLSCSTDRTIVVRERLERHVNERHESAYLTTRVVTLRATPLSMTISTENADIVLVSTMDRYLVKIDSVSGTITDSIKIADPETDDTVALNFIQASNRRGTSIEAPMNLMVAFSSIDKSIRVYDIDRCSLLTRESGHTEGISDMCLIEEQVADPNAPKRVIVSVGLDGTIMVWNISHSIPTLLSPYQGLSQSPVLSPHPTDNMPVKVSPASLPPLRKVLTKMDIIGFSNGVATGSPTSPRSLSPPRLTRKRSALALSATIEENDEENRISRNRQKETRPAAERGRSNRSPSPPPLVSTKPKKQRSRSEIGLDSTRTRQATRSPSPTTSITISATHTRQQEPNHSRLRRPPSVPTDLRGKALTQARQQSACYVSDSGSIGLATEQACRMLRMYRKKLLNSKEALLLDEIENELNTTIHLISEKRQTTSLQRGNRRRASKPVGEDEIEGLAILLDRTNMADTGQHTRRAQKV